MTEEKKPSNFIRTQIDDDLANGRYTHIHTRFPPEPNGYLHIGHTKSIFLNYGLAQSYSGRFNLRFDDTNPLKEEQEYVDSIINDIRWLGAEWEERLFFASDYFDQLHQWAVALIHKGLAYVDDLSADEIRAYRGTLTEPGRNSPYRNRTIEENLDLFERMKAGEFPDGTRVLRAKIDMSHPNINLRDPVLYRILHATHHRTGDNWCIYPMYDWAHGQSDSIEGITHSICTLEFEAHRPLYDWFIQSLGIYAPRQIEFARLALTYTILSKRKLIQLVRDGHVNGWDDPRMPTISGLRRRGYTPEALRNFCEMIGVAKANSTLDVSMLEYAIRDHLNHTADRVFAVLDPLKVVITNYPTEQVEEFEAINNPVADESERRIVPFSREIYIERGDFMENAPGKYKRMAPGRVIRLMNAYLVTCDEAIKDEEGHIVEVRCTFHPETRGGNAIEGFKPKGTIHWVSAAHAVEAEVRLYDRLFLKENPLALEAGQDSFLDNLNPDSLHIIPHAKVEPSLQEATVGQRFQFMRTGYFALDPDTSADKPIFNRVVTLRDTWAKLQKG